VNPRFTLEGQVAVVTGGAVGFLGPIWTDALIEAGARVAALDLPGAAPAETFRALAQRAGDRVRRFDCDITKRESIEAAADQVKSTMGVPSVLVNNAGKDAPPRAADSRHRLEDIPADEFRSMIEVNVLGTLQVIQVFGGRMAAASGGSIVNIGSLYASVSPDERFYDHMAGNTPFVKSPAYGASKAGVVNLTKFFATHWAARGVRVNTLSPGGVLGAQDDEFKRKFGARVPLGRMAQAEDLKGPLIFLASAASSYVTGQEIRVDGGFTAW
jgi:NAD(P)-dependent dehydrogenase (short-subunit alcohol dehydrogenase family)